METEPVTLSERIRSAALLADEALYLSTVATEGAPANGHRVTVPAIRSAGRVGSKR